LTSYTFLNIQMPTKNTTLAVVAASSDSSGRQSGASTRLQTPRQKQKRKQTPLEVDQSRAKVEAEERLFEGLETSRDDMIKLFEYIQKGDCINALCVNS
jgi:hypothetical protein